MLTTLYIDSHKKTQLSNIVDFPTIISLNSFSTIDNSFLLIIYI
jgi:hypothetical protein